MARFGIRDLFRKPPALRKISVYTDLLLVRGCAFGGFDRNNGYTNFFRGKISILFICILLTIASPGNGLHASPPCAPPENRACLLAELETAANEINDPDWRDKVLRELAKTYASDGAYERAIALLPQIRSPDTKAMTIRGIGMAFAEKNPETFFARLRAEADRIDHPPSHAIALTYISMAQARAGDDAGAAQTAAEMNNPALRNKAYAENAEIQAEREDLVAAFKSIEMIDDPAFRDKALRLVSEILAKEGNATGALVAARDIEDPLQRAQALQLFLDVQTAE